MCRLKLLATGLVRVGIGVLVLDEELPATPLPVPYPEGEAPSADADQDSPSASADSEGTSPIVVWAALGGVLVAVVAGGAFYLRARSPRG